MPISSTSGAVSNNAFGLLKSKALAPKFRIDLPAAKSILNGQSTSFTVLAVGAPTPTYQWYFDNSPIEGATSSTLNNVSAGGAYKVVATNSAGSATSTSCVLSVSAGAPIIITQPVDAFISRGETAEFYVQADGAVALNYQWYLNGSPMPPNTPNMATLYVENSFADGYTRDGNKYSCRVYNQLGEVFSEQAVLKFIGVKPTVVSVTPDIVAFEDETVSLSIVATGYPEPIIEWFPPNNQATVTGDNLSVTLSSPLYNYGDNYISYRVSNIYGSVSGSVRVTMQELIYPILMQAPSAELEIIADPSVDNFATISGEFFANPPVSLTFVNSVTGQTIGTTSSNSFSFNFNAFPSNSNFAPAPTSTSSDASVSPPSSSGVTWTYTYVVIPGGAWHGTTLPSQTTPSTNITVIVSKPILSGQPPEYVVGYIGETRYFNASAISKDGQQGLNYQWLSNENYPIGTSPSLPWDIVSISQNNKKFVCKIFNTAGEVFTRISTLKVQSATPIITTQPADQIVTSSLLGCITSTFNVAVYQPGTPVADTAMEYRWYVNDELQNESQLSASTLIFNSCDCNYDKNFFDVKVVIKNTVTNNETTSNTVKIQLKDLATILTQPDDVIASAGSTAQFSVDVCRKNNYIYRWYSENNNGIIAAVPGGNTFTLSVNVSSNDLNGYHYFCEISLPDGTSTVTTRQALLTVDQY